MVNPIVGFVFFICFLGSALDWPLGEAADQWNHLVTEFFFYIYSRRRGRNGSMDPVRCHSPSSLSLSLFLSQFSLSLSSFIDNIDDDKQDDTINNNDNNNNNNEDDDDDDDDDDGERGETNSKLRRRPAPPPPPPHRPIVPSSRF